MKQVQILSKRTTIHTVGFNGAHLHNLAGQDGKDGRATTNMKLLRLSQPPLEKIGAPTLNQASLPNCTLAYLANNLGVKQLKVPNIAQRAWIDSASPDPSKTHFF